MRLILASVALATGLAAVPASARPVGIINPAHVVEGEVSFGGALGGVAWNGQCDVRALNQRDLTGPTGYAAVFAGAMVAYEPAGLSPANGTLNCFVRINGFRGPGAFGSGQGVVVAAAERAYFAYDSDLVEICAEVNFGFGPIEECNETQSNQVPPQEVLDLVDSLFVNLVDPLLCPILSGLSPGVPPIVDINPEGDVWVSGGKVYDCPPYDF